MPTVTSNREEKRKRIRTCLLESSSVFIEIEHSFGHQKKSVYKVNEFDEFGLSFFIPYSDGYFLIGTPLSFFLITEDQTRSRHFGIVRYYSPFYRENGERFYKIGLELQAGYRDVMGHSFQLRPVRYSLLDTKNKSFIRFGLNGRTHEFELIDYSKYSVAFHYESNDIVLLRSGSLLNPVQIFMGDHLLYEGSATVTKIYQDKTGKNRTVIEPRKQVIDVEMAEKIQSVAMVAEESRALVKQHDSYQDIDSEFKCSVADFRAYLEDSKSYLESPKFKSREKDAEELLNELFEVHFPIVDSKIIQIDHIVRKLKLSPAENSLYKSYFQKHLLTLLLSAPVIHRSYFKPSGYPGDYAIMQLIHENRFDGDTLFSKLLNKSVTSNAAGVVTRKRTQYLSHHIAEFVRSRRRDPVEIFSIASGPSLEIEHLLKNEPEISSRISLTLLDQEINALKFSQEKLYESRIRYGSNMQIKFIHQTLGEYLRLIGAEKNSARYDLIYAFGLFDYFDDGVAKFVIRELGQKIKSAGEMMISNLSMDGFHYRSFIEYGMEWYMVYRNRKNLYQLVQNKNQSKVHEIENGTMKFLQIRRQ
ncbi:MAG: hypothetical protein JW774_06070 [Candidatus Aureabacteria bacterium]|nr:hypothetical protein [Candidatus Auribacterota bacterium]